MSEQYVINYQPARFAPYSPRSQQAKQGVKGRWQVMNEYGGWDNAHWCSEHVSVFVDYKPSIALIQSAPELLEALEDMTHIYDAYLNNIDCGPEYETYQRAKAAIAKAKS